MRPASPKPAATAAAIDHAGAAAAGTHSQGGQSDRREGLGRRPPPPGRQTGSPIHPTLSVGDRDLAEENHRLRQRIAALESSPAADRRGPPSRQDDQKG
jgi:hypothetical protein